MKLMISADPDFPGYDNVEGDAFDSDYLFRRAKDSPADWRRWLRLGYVLEQRCEGEAVSALAKAVSLNPRNALAHYLLARATSRAGKPRKAMRALETAVKVRPDYADAWSLLGALRVQTGRVDKAVDAWSQAARLAPDGETYWQIAKCFISLRRIAEATVALEEAVRLKPNHTVAHGALAHLGRLRGESDVERRHLQLLFTLDEDMARRLEIDLGR
jgi:protein O-GlcNAc transferase